MNGETIALVATSATTGAAVVTAVVLALKGRSDARKGEREVSVAEREADVAERAQANDDAETTLRLLREQVDLLRQHRDEREKEYKDERATARAREAKLEERIKSLEERQRDAERDYRNLVLTITSMGFCANAGTCPNNDPGDRRGRKQRPSEGGRSGDTG